MNSLRLIAIVSTAIVSGTTHASITSYLDQKLAWLSAAGATTFIDFIPPNGQVQPIAADTFASLGVMLGSYPAGSPTWYDNNSTQLYTDGWGMTVEVGYALQYDFIQPIHAFAFDRFKSVASSMLCNFYNDGELVGTSTIVVPIGSFDGSHHFGWITEFEFDSVAFSSYAADNIYFSTIPTPATLALLAMIGIAVRRRRR